MGINRYSVGVRLTVGFGVLLCITVAIAALGLSRMTTLNRTLTTLTETTFVRLSILDKMRDAVRAQAISLRDVVMQEDLSFKKGELKLMKAARENYLALSQALHGMLTEDGRRGDLEKIAVIEGQIKSLVEQAINQSMDDQHDLAGATVREQIRPAQMQLVEAIDQLARDLETQADAETAEAKTEYRNAIRALVTLSVITVLLGLVLSYRLRGSIVRPLRVAVDLGAHVAKGNLTARGEAIGNDEFAELVRTLNGMCDSLSGTIGDVQKSGEQAAALAAKLADSTKRLTGSMHAQAERTSAVSHTMEEMSDSIREVLRGANGVLEAADNSKSTVSTAESTASDASETASRVLGSVEKASHSINTLNSAIERVAEITAAIGGISEQTNLLALNAAIESARAGEHGRGFGIVAEEVRQLSRRTSVCVTDIASIVAEIRGHSRATVEIIGTVTNEVKQGTRHVEATGQSLRLIDESATQVAAMANNIVVGTTQQSTAADEAASNVGSIAKLSQEVSEAAGHVDALAGELANTANNLEVIANRFRTA